MAKPKSQDQDIAAAMSEAARTWHGLKGHEREEAILQFLPFVEYLCKRMLIGMALFIDVRDLIQSGVVGLIDALNKFDPDQGVNIKTYAEIRIRGAVLDFLRSLDWMPRSVRRFNRELDKLRWRMSQELGKTPTDDELARALWITLDEFTQKRFDTTPLHHVDLDARVGTDDDSHFVHETIMDERAVNPLSAILASETEVIIARAIEDLPFRQRLVVSLYFFEGMTEREISDQLEISESRVSQILSEVLVQKIAPALQLLISSSS